MGSLSLPSPTKKGPSPYLHDRPIFELFFTEPFVQCRIDPVPLLPDLDAVPSMAPVRSPSDDEPHGYLFRLADNIERGSDAHAVARSFFEYALNALDVGGVLRSFAKTVYLFDLVASVPARLE